MASELNARQEQLIREQAEFITDYLKEHGNVFVVNEETGFDTDNLVLTPDGCEKVTDECEIISAAPYMTSIDYYVIGMTWDKVYERVLVYGTRVDDVCAVEEIRLDDVMINEYSKLIGLIINGVKIENF